MRKLSIVLFSLVVASCFSSPEGTRDGDCADAKDNDGNGLVDCEDEGCSLDDECLKLAAKAKLAEEAAREASAPPARDTSADDGLEYVDLGEIWVQKGHNGSDISQPQAKQYCETLTLAGKNDWRLPTEEEATAASRSGKLPNESLVMWTSTEKSAKRAVIVGISTGAVNDLGLHSVGDCRARCVRDR
ncbi:MAG: DUF1566 domain-containing protein [Deltaproteobacteria bacterium]|nr:DUF1566 domain-containing protein [Deltaproteobacteria bacterium]